MTKKRSRSHKMTRKQNPTTIKSNRPPRNTFGFDGSVLHATILVGANSTAANVGSDYQLIGTDAGVGLTRVMNAMVRQYREYRFKRVVCQWIPSVGPATADSGSRVHLAYTDNPEQMVGFTQSTPPFVSTLAKVAYCRGSRNAVSFNAWERFTWNVPLTRRRPWFDVNTTDPSPDANSYSRSVQGLVVQGYESVSAAIVLGTMKVVFEIELRGLDVDVSAIT